jgi:hypothetical protein
MPDDASYLAPDKEVHSLVHLQPTLVTDLFYTPVECMGEKRNKCGVWWDNLKVKHDCEDPAWMGRYSNIS